MRIGLLREEKIPADNRVALTPIQCKWIHANYPDVKITAEASPHRSFSDAEYRRAGVAISHDLSSCDVLLGIKEVPAAKLIEGKTYLFFSHTRKQQSYNQKLLQTILQKHITLIDYECMEHADGQRILGFGFFAGIVGAHNGMMAYGRRTGTFELERVYKQKDLKALIHSYFGLKIPNIKIAVTGSGRVAHGILEIMNLMGIIEVEKDEYVSNTFDYPVYVQLKGADLYKHKQTGKYSRQHFHTHPAEYDCVFKDYVEHTDILMNGIYWDVQVPRLFSSLDITHPSFRIQVIADVTDDANGSVPINLGDQSIENPVYGVDKHTLMKTEPYKEGSIDVMAVGNLPNELPRDASDYFGEQFIKYVLPQLIEPGDMIKYAMMVEKGRLTPRFEYLSDYAAGIIDTDSNL